MTWEELRVILNNIAESEDKSSLDEPVVRVDEESWCLDLAVSASSGKLLFINVMIAED